jgi:CPA2 family monovalent cation:H+ antiporter-2
MNPDVVHAERRHGRPIMYGDATRPDILLHAGAREARVLVVAISDAAATRATVSAARAINPGLHVIVRSRYVKEMEPLLALGADVVVPEEFETSIEIFSRVLRHLLVPRDVIDRSVREIRGDTYEMFRALHQEHRPVTGIQRVLPAVQVETYRVHPGAPVSGGSLRRLRLRERHGVTVVAIQRGEQVDVNPTGDATIEADDIVVLIGRSDDLTSAAALFHGATPAAPAAPRAAAPVPSGST